MAVSPFLATTFRFLEVTGVTDVQTIIDNVRTELVTNLGWTEPVANRFKSPVDAAGQFMEVSLLRNAATELEMTVFDTVGRSFSRELQISGTVSVRFLTGSHHFYVENVTGAEYLWANILSLDPEAESAHDQNVVGNGSRSTGGSLGSNNVTFVNIVNSGSYILAQKVLSFYIPDESLASFDPPETLNKSRLWIPVFLMSGAATFGGVVMGRCYQMLVVSSTLIVGAEVVVAIDEATTGTFKVLGIPTANSYRLAMRKS